MRSGERSMPPGLNDLEVVAECARFALLGTWGRTETVYKVSTERTRWLFKPKISLLARRGVRKHASLRPAVRHGCLTRQAVRDTQVRVPASIYT